MSALQESTSRRGRPRTHRKRPGTYRWVDEVDQMLDDLSGEAPRVETLHDLIKSAHQQRFPKGQSNGPTVHTVLPQVSSRTQSELAPQVPPRDQPREEPEAARSHALHERPAVAHQDQAASSVSGVAIPPKPRFPDRAYEDGRGVRISAAREALWKLDRNELLRVDQIALSYPNIVDDEVWCELYETMFAAWWREMEQREESEKKAKELALPPNPRAELCYQVLDKKLKATYSLKAFDEYYKTHPEDFVSAEAFELFEDRALAQLERQEIERAKQHGGEVPHPRGGTREFFVGMAAVAAVKLTTEEHQRERKERAAFRAKRSHQLTQSDKQVITAAVIVEPQLRQAGDPRLQRQYHDRDWREAVGDKAKRSTPLLGKSSQSAFDPAHPTRKERRDAEKASKDIDSS